MMNSETVVKVSANELSTGMTKLSGSRPFLKVRTATPKDIKIIKIAAKVCVARSRAMNLRAAKEFALAWERELISA